MNGTKVTRQSEDGEEYEVIQTPATIEFHDLRVVPSHSFSDGYSFHHLYVPCSQVKSIGLPTDANPREPTRADVVKRMEITIKENPEKFHHMNNGISIICDNVEAIGEDTVKIVFQEGDGICNGGHTYFSIVTHPDIPDSCLVHLELIKLPNSLDTELRKQVINDIASARNRNRQLLPTTQADYLGYYDPFKNALGSNQSYISWHEGDSDAHRDAIKSDHFIRMLACVDPFWFNHPQIKSRRSKQNHKSATGGIAANHNRWMSGVDNGDFEENLYHMAPLGSELLELRDYISYSLKNDSFSEVSGNLRKTKFFDWYSGDTKSNRPLHHGIHCGKVGYKLPATFEILLIGTFRYNVWISLTSDGEPILIGALDTFTGLWDETKCDLLEKLKSLFVTLDNDSASFNRAESSFDYQLIDLLYGKKPPAHPEYFYNIATRDRYVHDEKNPTHYLTISDGKYAELTEIEDDPVPKEAFLYRKV